MIQVDENEVKQIIEHLSRTGTYSQVAMVIQMMSRWLGPDKPKLEEVREASGDSS